MSSFLQQQQQGSARAPIPCTAGCGFFGSPGTLDMCSVCYKKHCAVNGAKSAAIASRSAVAAAAIGTTASSTAAEPAASSIISFAPAARATAAGIAASAAAPSSSAPGAAKKAQPTRCAACRKKVGLTGFVCRCTKTFCGAHRYAEEHGCSFDFKGAGRDGIARSNPLVKGEKLPGRI